MLLRARDHRLELVGRPLLMGIVNATPDSFSDAGQREGPDQLVAHGRELLAAGADILDVGGESARGDTSTVPVEEESERVVPVVERLTGQGALVSVDTHKAAVAEAALAAGAAIVNDVSGLRDPALAELCARTGAALVLVHTRVRPKGTLLDPGAYDDVVADVHDFLRRRMEAARAAGVADEQLILDPGPDFAKTPAQTIRVLRRLDVLHALGRPIMLAASRKDFLGAITGREPGARDAATLAAVEWGVQAGVQILRVHDVAAAADYLSVREVLRGERELAAAEGLTPDRYPDGPPPHVPLD